MSEKVRSVFFKKKNCSLLPQHFLQIHPQNPNPKRPGRVKIQRQAAIARRRGDDGAVQDRIAPNRPSGEQMAVGENRDAAGVLSHHIGVGEHDQVNRPAAGRVYVEDEFGVGLVVPAAPVFRRRPACPDDAAGVAAGGEVERQIRLVG